MSSTKQSLYRRYGAAAIVLTLAVGLAIGFSHVATPATRLMTVLLRRASPNSLFVPTGPYNVRIAEVALPSNREDASTPAISVKLWFPEQLRNAVTGPEASDPSTPKEPSSLPVLLYAPGSRGVKTDNTLTATDVASHGYAVVAIDDVELGQGPDGGFPATEDFDLSTPAAFKAMLETKDEKVRRQAERAIAVIDRLGEYKAPPGVPWPVGLKLDRVGFFGWSFGGATARQASILDPRIVASINFDGWLFADAVEDKVLKPSMTILSDYAWPSLSKLRSGVWSSRYDALEDLRDLREKMRIGTGSDGYFVRFKGAVHESYSDKIFDWRFWKAWSKADPYAVKSTTDRYVIAFFDRYLKGQRAELLNDAHTPKAEAEFLTISNNWPEVDLKGTLLKDLHETADVRRD